jgi:hypothetical protein
MLKTAFRRFLSVEQPLRPFFKESSWRKAVRVADGRAAMDSILGNLFCG